VTACVPAIVVGKEVIVRVFEELDIDASGVGTPAKV
jgi:hypothetical protein